MCRSEVRWTRRWRGRDSNPRSLSRGSRFFSRRRRGRRSIGVVSKGTIPSHRGPAVRIPLAPPTTLHSPKVPLTPKKSRRRTTSRHRRGLRVANPRQGDFAKPDCETRRRRASGATRPRRNTISQQRLRTMAKNARSPLASRRAVLFLGGSKESADPTSRGLSDCAACHHVALLTPEMLLRAGLSPAAT